MLNEKIINICKQKLIYLNYANRTVEIYMHYIQKFLEQNQHKQVVHLSAKDFQDYLDNFSFSSVSQQNQIINAIRFLYRFALNKKYDKVSFDRPRKEKRIPKVIDYDVIIHAIEKINNLKHKCIISLAYSVGLRVSEIINLKINDIDSQRMIITIYQAKGRKDRVVPLSEKVLTLLRQYYKAYKPKVYLFNGQDSLQYSAKSCNKLVKKYIGSNFHFHTLRHSCFTHLLEKGVDLRIIQKLAGHKSSKTTEIYTHVSNNLLSTIPLPV